ALRNELAPFMTVTELGNVVYVSPIGNNATGQRGRIDKPFLTIQGALDSANGTQQYDIVHIMPGNYVGDVATFGARGWGQGFGNVFVLDNATITGDFTMDAGIGGDLGYSIIGIGKSKIIGTVGVGHGDHQAKDIKNVEITNGIRCRVFGVVSGCKVGFVDTYLPIYSGLWIDNEITSTNPNGLGATWLQSIGMTFRRCSFKIVHFGQQTFGRNDFTRFYNCDITGTDDAIPLITWAGQGVKIAAQNCSFNFGQKLYEHRLDNGYTAEESFYFQNCIFNSATGSQLISKTQNAGAEPSYLELLNCISNVPAGAPITLEQNFIVSPFTRI
ncbi:MAG TPA: hypothetical protein VK927_10900, partial [Adhaeribacter sp.]|nr:hypothetical protein [Adhaeribacter sp.]